MKCVVLWDIWIQRRQFIPNIFQIWPKWRLMKIMDDHRADCDKTVRRMRGAIESPGMANQAACNFCISMEFEFTL